MPELTPTEQAVLNDLKRRYCIGQVIQPEVAYPGHDNVDNTRRRTVRRLCEKGYLDKAPGYPASAAVYVLK